MKPVMKIYNEKWELLGVVDDKGTQRSLSEAKKRWPNATRVVPDLE